MVGNEKREHFKDCHKYVCHLPDGIMESVIVGKILYVNGNEITYKVMYNKSKHHWYYEGSVHKFDIYSNFGRHCKFFDNKYDIIVEVL